jgi:DNA-binding CsgD family transcriptional regulator
VLERVVTEGRATGSPGLLPYALHALALVETRRGRLAAAIEAAAEAAELGRALGQLRELLMAVGALAWIAALLGREDDCLQYLEAQAAAWETLAQDPPPEATKGMLALSVGRTDDAIRELEALATEPRAFADAIAPRSFVPNLVEAYVRAGRDGEAEALLEPFEALANRSGRPASRAPALRCRAALEGSEEHFEAALALHDEWRNPFERARTQLLYGEFLRRQKRRAAARVRLRAALAVFDDVGAVGWAERTRIALKATGERARRRDPSTLDDLTPQETTVARLVASGLTNRDVATRLFLSPKTIETHLAHVFRKTGVRTRTELANKLRDSPDSSGAPGS